MTVVVTAERPESADMLARLISGTPISEKDMRDVVVPQLRGLASRFVRSTDGLFEVDDLVNEAHIELDHVRDRYDPARGSARAFMYGVMRTALRRLHALYAPPGVKTRDVGAMDRQVSLDEQVGVADVNEGVTLADTIAISPSGTPARLGEALADDLLDDIVAWDLLDFTLAQLDEPSARAVFMLATGKASTRQEVARLTGVSRFTLARRLHAVESVVSAAA